MSRKIELTSNQTIVFTGDSITDCGRRERAHRPLGTGYVHFAANILLARHPQLQISVINTGISGNTTRDLMQRWQRDCIGHQPDILSVLIGINDLWRQFAMPRDLPMAVYIDEYRSNYRRLLLEVSKKCNCQIILIEPFMFCNDADNEMFKALKGYIDVVHILADEFDAALVPLQSGINETIGKAPPSKWSDDMVHPFMWAHAWIAEQWLEEVSVLNAER